MIQRIVFLLLILLTSCVDPTEINLHGAGNVIVVDGTVTNLIETQSIQLSQAKADGYTGQFETVPLIRATVEIVVDSASVFTCHETIDGTYQLPDNFRGQVGHAYQLRFHLSDGTQYASDQQVMPAVPPIARVQAEFNATSLSPAVFDGYTAAHDFYLDVQDPADSRNYYRWDWRLWERQFWCQSCEKGVYAINKILPNIYKRDKDLVYFVSGNEPYNDCFTPPPGYAEYTAPFVPDGQWHYDYECASPCWETFYNQTINVFDDANSNGGLIQRRNIAQVPFYTHEPGLVDIRQSALTKDAYIYYRLLQEQTQRTGGLVDTPPAALAGNVASVADPRKKIVGYFTASAVVQVHYWLDRKDVQGFSLGEVKAPGKQLDNGEELYSSLTGRRLRREPPPPYILVAGVRDVPDILIWGGPPRPPFAPCLQSDHRTPFKPEGWRE